MSRDEKITSTKEMNILSICGASTAGAGVCGVLEELQRSDFKATHYVCTSYGSVVALPFVLGKLEDIKRVTLEIDHKNFFKVVPMTKKGGITVIGIIRSIASLIFPNKIKSVGIQDIQGLLKNYVSEKEFLWYQNSELPEIFICAVKVCNMEPELFNIKDKSVSYQQWLDITSASSRIPVWTQPMTLEGNEYYDGGVTDINPSCLLLDKFNSRGEVVKELVSIYPFGKGNKVEGKAVRGVIGAIIWIIEALVKNVGKNDALEERFKCDYRGISLSQIFIPKILSNTYDTNPSRLKELYLLGKHVFYEQFRK